MPEHHATDDECVPQLVDSRAILSAAVVPPHLVAQADKDPMHLTQAQSIPPAPATRTHQERRFVGDLDMVIAERAIALQGIRRARMQRHLARLGELGPPYGQHARLQVDIGILQMHRFGDTQTGRRDQAEQRLVGRPAQASRGAEAARCGQQVDDLLVAINVRGQSLADSAKDGVVRYLGVWLDFPVWLGQVR